MAPTPVALSWSYIMIQPKRSGKERRAPDSSVSGGRRGQNGQGGGRRKPPPVGKTVAAAMWRKPAG
jgi:hypothetical protein